MAVMVGRVTIVSHTVIIVISASIETVDGCITDSLNVYLLWVQNGPYGKTPKELFADLKKFAMRLFDWFFGMRALRHRFFNAEGERLREYRFWDPTTCLTG